MTKYVVTALQDPLYEHSLINHPICHVLSFVSVVQKLSLYGCLNLTFRVRLLMVGEDAAML